SRPHIGTFRLVSMVEKMRASIHDLGGEVRFATRVADIELDQGKVRSLKLSNGETLRCDHVVLAVGHSAR
ncbi:FAD-dependent oxidoreductase, partial [Clostridioides difficile]|nr:FAD-dependent oxidoreductase [Clostridioides difficile]